MRLELVVNEAPTGEIVAVEHDSGRFLIDAADLRAAYFPLPPQAKGLIDVTAIPGVHVTYRQETQQLALTVPVDWREPLPGYVQTQVMTHPCLLVKLPNGAFSQIRVVDQDGRLRLEGVR